VFQSGRYEDDIQDNSTWATGDWSGDGEFSTADLLLAFQSGGYERGPREAVFAVPEPTGVMPWPIAWLAFSLLGRCRKAPCRF
jgi:hypothetical protein